MMLVSVANDIEAVHVPELEIDDHQIRRSGIQGGDTVPSREDFGHFVSLHTAGFAHQVENGSFVVDYKNLCHGGEIGLIEAAELLAELNTTVFLINAIRKISKMQKSSQFCSRRRFGGGKGGRAASVANGDEERDVEKFSNGGKFFRSSSKNPPGGPFQAM